MDEFLTKPIRAADLWAAIDRLVRARRVARSSSAEPAGTGRAGICSTPSLCSPPAGAMRSGCAGCARTCRPICRPDWPRWARPCGTGTPADSRGRAQAVWLLFAFSTAAGDVASDLEDLAAQGRLEEARPLVERLEAMGREYWG